MELTLSLSLFLCYLIHRHIQTNFTEQTDPTFTHIYIARIKLSSPKCTAWVVEVFRDALFASAKSMFRIGAMLKVLRFNTTTQTYGGGWNPNRTGLHHGWMWFVSGHGSEKEKHIHIIVKEKILLWMVYRQTYTIPNPHPFPHPHYILLMVANVPNVIWVTTLPRAIRLSSWLANSWHTKTPMRSLRV